MPRTLLIAVVTVLSSAAVAASAVAADNAESTTVSTEPVEWALPAGLCPDLPPDLSVMGEGTARVVARASVDPQGVLHVKLITAMTGTATDSAGAGYQWNYHNVQSAQITEFPFVVTLTDHFNLVGAGAANEIHTSFTIRVLVEGPGAETRLLFRVNGFPGRCDPL